MNSVIINDGELKARVLNPENTHYVRTRFNHSAFLPDVWYKGMKFTQYERNQNDGFNSTDGSGICCDYDGGMIMRESKPGEYFLRPGVGIIKRGEVDLGLADWSPYEALGTKWDAQGNKAHFETNTKNVNGFAYAETRDVELNGDTITMKMSLKNTGDRYFEFAEYGHNFLSLGDEEVGPGYRLETPGFVDPSACNSLPLAYSLVGDKTGFGFSGEVRKSFYVKSTDVRKADVTWKMTHEGMSAFISESDSFTPSQIAVWGDYYVFSCEVFIPVKLNPGEEISWSRKWRFGV